MRVIMRYMGMILGMIPNDLQQPILLDTHCSRNDVSGYIGCVEEFLSRVGINAFWTGTQVAEEERVVGVS